jgi:RNA polymerase sigma-70 factor (ECF subfamily)
LAATPPTDQTEHDRATTTLGDLLYADGAKILPLEDEWIGLVAAIARRDQRALRSLYERSHRIVFTLIMRIVRDRLTAEELTLDVFYDVWRRAPEYETTGGSVLGWMLNQARSRAIDRLRFDQRQKRVRPSGENPLPEHAASSADEALALTQHARLLRDCLDVLSAGERDAIETTYFHELTHAEAAARLKQPVGTLKTRIRSGLEKLRHALAEAMRLK